MSHVWVVRGGTTFGGLPTFRTRALAREWKRAYGGTIAREKTCAYQKGNLS
jgi:hypothetical protein